MAALPPFDNLWNGVTRLLTGPPPGDPVIERLRQISQVVVAEKRAMDRRAGQAIHAIKAIAPARLLEPEVDDAASSHWDGQ